MTGLVAINHLFEERFLALQGEIEARRRDPDQPTLIA
jgi:hypothetical protein